MNGEILLKRENIFIYKQKSLWRDNITDYIINLKDDIKTLALKNLDYKNWIDIALKKLKLNICQLELERILI